jgi:hypothetical protein
MRNAHKILIEKPERSRPLCRTKRCWDHNIKIYLKGREYEGVNWIVLAQGRD